MIIATPLIQHLSSLTRRCAWSPERPPHEDSRANTAAKRSPPDTMTRFNAPGVAQVAEPPSGDGGKLGADRQVERVRSAGEYAPFGPRPPQHRTSNCVRNVLPRRDYPVSSGPDPSGRRQPSGECPGGDGPQGDVCLGNPLVFGGIPSPAPGSQGYGARLALRNLASALLRRANANGAGD